MKKEYDLKKLKNRKQGAVAEKQAKVLKSFRIDLDVLAWLQAEGERRGIPYQTLMNSMLRGMMTGESAPTDLRAEIRQMIQEEFDKRAS